MFERLYAGCPAFSVARRSQCAVCSGATMFDGLYAGSSALSQDFAIVVQRLQVEPCNLKSLSAHTPLQAHRGGSLHLHLVPWALCHHYSCFGLFSLALPPACRVGFWSSGFALVQTRVHLLLHSNTACCMRSAPGRPRSPGALFPAPNQSFPAPKASAFPMHLPDRQMHGSLLERSPARGHMTYSPRDML